ncbi:LOW QUALITY PROTEIN: hypothetical protein Cgig2_001647 [Carnegiea gigantea]|uniref:DUF4283 domain-containing protein n=1 Tax=Carnegiea gigantea TaxID=171969 RepID=A0A9Q1JRH9_9CARY|nr:LOW QUALITY PROTEIN: hypothetical protein Cgig2_001647 [Carnegiea gigantea]
MASGIEEAWQNLTLTADEASTDNDKEDKLEQILLCLLGRLFTDVAFNARVMEIVLSNVWKPAKGLVVCDLDTNLFVFQFLSQSNKDHILNDRPWAFEGHILLLKEMIGMETPFEAIKERILCPGSRNPAAQPVASPQTPGMGQHVDIDISKPLRRSIHVQVAGKSIWVRFKYVKFPDFCYGWGKLGHTLKGCDVVEVDKGNSNLQ